MREPEETQSVYDRSIEGWHLDKRVPVALILTIFLAVMTGVYAYSRLESTVEDHETRIDRLEAHDIATDRSTLAVLNEVARLDATLVAELSAIKTMLQALREDLREMKKR